MVMKYKHLESNSISTFLIVLKKLVLIMIIMTILFTSCQKKNEQEQSRNASVSQDSSENQLSASELEDFAIMSIKIGNATRAIDQWGRAANIYASIQGKESDQARCLDNRARAFASIDQHDKAVEELIQAKSILDLVGIKDRSYQMILIVLHREQTLLEMIAEYKMQRSKTSDYQSSSSIRPQTLILAKKLLNDYGFRRSFLMDKAEPKSFPDQIKTALELNDIELNALCLYGYKIHVKYHELLKKKFPLYMGATFDLSPDFYAAISKHREEANSLLKLLEEKVGSEPNIDE
jgi:hypothetical protein